MSPMDKHQRPLAARPTLGILFAGEMGSTLGRILLQQGYRVVTPLAERGARTRRLAKDAGLEAVGSVADLAGVADVVFSVVPPGAALAVARQYCAEVAPGSDRVFVDVNSIAPATALAVADACRRHGVHCVDGAVHGMAARLPASGTLYLSGPLAERVAGLFSAPLRVKVLGATIGQASAFKMMISGMAKGVVALFLEMGLAAREAKVLDDLLVCYRDAYPGIMALVDRLLPTYPQHAARRADELKEVEETLRELGVEPCMVSGARQITDAVGRASLPARAADRDPPDWSVSEVVEAIFAHGLLNKSLPPVSERLP
jgi:3-hydroxyisobutyrate dehydrogenase-like beta-hydroxyacid dehydrogenase